MNTQRETGRSAAESNGELPTFTSLYESYRRPLYRYCLSIAHDTALAEDAVQEAFVRLHRDLPSLREKNSVRCWLFAVARNQVIGSIRRKKFQVPMGAQDAADTDTPEMILEQEESAAIVRRMLGTLNEDYREILVLREYDDFTYAEIAEITSSSLPAVKSRLFHARRALAERLRPWLDERVVR